MTCLSSYRLNNGTHVDCQWVCLQITEIVHLVRVSGYLLTDYDAISFGKRYTNTPNLEQEMSNHALVLIIVQ